MRPDTKRKLQSILPHGITYDQFVDGVLNYLKTQDITIEELISNYQTDVPAEIEAMELEQ